VSALIRRSARYPCEYISGAACANTGPATTDTDQSCRPWRERYRHAAFACANATSPDPAAGEYDEEENTMAVKLKETPRPGIHRRHGNGCDGKGACGCPYRRVRVHQGRQYTETFQSLADAQAARE
jgi:hypothetical protein